ncbi:MAG: hypothetical protein QXL94_06665 [Candidatus Parvarchaeum sp.]
MNNLTIYNQNVLDALHNIPDSSIDCIVTSPPYYGLRFYGTETNAKERQLLGTLKYNIFKM